MEQAMSHWDIESEQRDAIAGVLHSPIRLNHTPYILLVTRGGHMSEEAMDYALAVADRLHYSILASHVDTLPFFADGGKRSKRFAAAVHTSMALFKTKASSLNITVEFAEEMGRIGAVVNRLCHTQKHIEFVIVDQDVLFEDVRKQSPVPVFRVIAAPGQKGRNNATQLYKTMRKGVESMSTISRKRHVKNCLVFGAMTAGLYAAVFTHQSFVMTYFAKGGVFSLLPVAMVFAVSYAHGNFTSSFWSALGIEASKATAVQKAEIDRVQESTVAIPKDVRPRAQVSV